MVWTHTLYILSNILSIFIRSGICVERRQGGGVQLSGNKHAYTHTHTHTHTHTRPHTHTCPHTHTHTPTPTRPHPPTHPPTHTHTHTHTHTCTPTTHRYSESIYIAFNQRLQYLLMQLYTEWGIQQGTQHVKRRVKEVRNLHCRHDVHTQESLISSTHRASISIGQCCF